MLWLYSFAEEKNTNLEFQSVNFRLHLRKMVSRRCFCTIVIRVSKVLDRYCTWQFAQDLFHSVTGITIVNVSQPGLGVKKRQIRIPHSGWEKIPLPSWKKVFDKWKEMEYSSCHRKTDEREKYPFGRSTESGRRWEGCVRKIGEWSRKGELKDCRLDFYFPGVRM